MYITKFRMVPLISAKDFAGILVFVLTDETWRRAVSQLSLRGKQSTLYIVIHTASDYKSSFPLRRTLSTLLYYHIWHQIARVIFHCAALFEYAGFGAIVAELWQNGSHLYRRCLGLHPRQYENGCDHTTAAS